MVKDPLFIMQGESAGAELDPAPGVDVQKISDAIVATPKETIDLAASAQK